MSLSCDYVGIKNKSKELRAVFIAETVSMCLPFRPHPR